MEKERLIQQLKDYKEERITLDEMITSLRHLPFEELDFAKVDHHRSLRNGFPEVVYCKGKTTEQICAIFTTLASHNSNILLTRASKNVFTAIKKLNANVLYNEAAKTIVLSHTTATKEGILLLSAGTADIPVAEEAAVTAEVMGNRVEKIYDVGVAGIHRLLAHIHRFEAARCIIVVAGMDGALPSVVGGLTAKPIIAVPTSIGYGVAFQGLAPLLTMLNSCAAGIGVVNIDNGFGAGYLASLINQ